MEELIPKKRKRSSPSPNPFAGVFTRSKSQIYLHCHRSGRARSDSFRRSKSHYELWSTPSGASSKKFRRKSVTGETSDSTQMEERSSFLIKDLRTRRVFSLGSIADESEEEKESEKKKGPTEDGLSSDNVKLDCIRSASLIEKEGVDTTCLDARKAEQSKSEFSSHEQNITNLQVVEGTGNCVDGEISAEECAQATPPDADILQKLSISSDGVQDNIDKKDSNYSEPISVRNSRSRDKLFKAPYSFSYRRLLPYLTGMVQYNSYVSAGAATNGDSSNVENKSMIADAIKVDNSMETPASDKRKFGDELSAHHIADSAILIPPQKDSPTIVSSRSSSDGKLCSKNFVDNLNENIQKRVPSKDNNLESSTPECSLKLHNPGINGDFNESKSLDGDYSAKRHQFYEDDEVRQGSCSAMQTESMGIQLLDIRCSDKAIDAKRLGSYVSSEGENNTKKEGDDNVVTDKIDDSNEESIRMTLPAVDILGKTMAYQNADNGVKLVSQSAGHVLGRPVNEIVPQNKSCSSDKRMNSSKRKLGLSPCSQLKLLQTRSSFSYRRLLPILMDIAKDSSGDFGNVHSPKVEKIVEENLLSPLSMSMDETWAQKLNNNSDSCTIHMAKQTSNHESGCMLPSLAACEHRNDNPNSVVKEQEQVLQVMQVISDDKKHLSTSAIENLTHETKPDTMTVCSSVFNPNSYAVVLADTVVHESSANGEEESKTSWTKVEDNAANPVQASKFNLSQNSYQLDASGPLEIQISVNGSKKGILKRNPRGCRGPCTCLNCSSFRLNAERAFEFSKNQMLDAEEVALELIKELSHLRNMLGTAASGCADNLVIHINQVKEAFVRASEAETVAKSRLAQMNYDLNIHCRTTDGHRPRVKFANNSEQSN